MARRIRRTAAALTVAASVLGGAAAARADTLVVPSDDFPTIQSAVDASGPGDLVLVGPGEYAETVNVPSASDLEIRGRGWPVIKPPAGPGFDVYGETQGLLLQGFAVEGASYGVSLYAVADVRLVKLRISGSTQSGIISEDGDGVLVSKCAISASAVHGIEDQGSTGLVIEKCLVEASDNDAMNLSPQEGESGGSNGAFVTKNRITGADAGIRFGGEGAEISKNRIEAFSEAGIVLPAATSSDDTTITGNRVSGGGGAFAIMVFSSQSKVTKNAVAGHAFYFDGNAHVIEANRVSGGIYGIYASGADVEITGNRIRDVSAFGIRCNGAGSLVGANVVAGVSGNGIEIAGSGTDVAGNRVSGATGAGIDIATTGCLVTGNRARGSGGVDLRDHNVPGVNTYEGNRFGTEEFEPIP